jgi:hypothetical protein
MKGNAVKLDLFLAAPVGPTPPLLPALQPSVIAQGSRQSLTVDQRRLDTSSSQPHNPIWNYTEGPMDRQDRKVERRLQLSWLR